MKDFLLGGCNGLIIQHMGLGSTMVSGKMTHGFNGSCVKFTWVMDASGESLLPEEKRAYPPVFKGEDAGLIFPACSEEQFGFGRTEHCRQAKRKDLGVSISPARLQQGHMQQVLVSPLAAVGCAVQGDHVGPAASCRLFLLVLCQHPQLLHSICLLEGESLPAPFTACL